MPPTIGRALNELEAAHFVGRTAELESFRAWLDAENGPPILNVVGRGGMGKTTLLSAFARHARSIAREVLSVDAEGIEDTPGAFLEALGTAVEDPIRFCNDNRCLVLIDSFAKAASLPRYLQEEFLPKLSREVKVVIAGRIPLNWTRWGTLVETMTLDILSPENAVEFLNRRGITDPMLCKQVNGATHGLPLALALASDLVTKLGAKDLAAAGEWRLVVRSLVERFLHEVSDQQLAELLEAGAIVRHFDEPTLAAITDREDVAEPFARLCGLSFVRAGEHGLMLHDDVRHAMADDLRWRNPERYAALRERALAYLRGRMARATPAERHWLWAERMFLWEDAFVRSVLFDAQGSDDISVTVAGPSGAPDALALERRWHDQVLPRESRVEWSDDYPQEGVLVWLERAMRMEGTRLALARDAAGAYVGYSLVVPLYQASLRLLQAEETLSALVRAYWSPLDLAALPSRSEEADAYVIVRTCVLDIESEAANAALMRDLLGLLGREGTYVVYAAFPERRALYETLGFEPVPTPEVYHWIADYPFQAYVLDLKRVGFEGWIEAVMAGRTPARRPTADDVEKELSDLLPRWDEDQLLEVSQLGAFAGGAEPARAMIRAALEGLRNDEDLSLALRALELAYLERAASHERLAERLAVSRSTFYRFLRRGIRAIAEAVGRPGGASRRT